MYMFRVLFTLLWRALFSLSHFLGGRLPPQANLLCYSCAPAGLWRCGNGGCRDASLHPRLNGGRLTEWLTHLLPWYSKRSGCRSRPEHHPILSTILWTGSKLPTGSEYQDLTWPGCTQGCCQPLKLCTLLQPGSFRKPLLLKWFFVAWKQNFSLPILDLLGAIEPRQRQIFILSDPQLVPLQLGWLLLPGKVGH